MSKSKLCCGSCGATDVKLYRPYGNFYRPEDNICNDCAPENYNERGWLVPCIVDKSDGTIWGTFSENPKAKQAWKDFFNTPEKNHNKPKWDKINGKWEDASEYS